MLVSLVDCIQQCASFFQSRLLYTCLQQMVQFNSIDCAIQQALYTVLYITIEQQYIDAVQCEHKSFTYTYTNTHTCAWPQLQGLSSVMSSVASCPCNASPRSVPSRPGTQFVPRCSCIHPLLALSPPPIRKRIRDYEHCTVHSLIHQLTRLCTLCTSIRSDSYFRCTQWFSSVQFRSEMCCSNSILWLT